VGEQADELPKPVTGEEIEQLLAADIDAIREKVQQKKPLTDSERKRLEAHGRALKGVGSNEGDALEPIWAANQVELAKELSCSRKQIQRYMKLEGDEAPPAPAADGRHNVTLWKLWAQEHGYLRKKLSSAADRQLLEDRTIQLRNERFEMENAQARGELLSVSEVTKVVVDMFGQIVQPLRGMKHTLGPLVVGTTVPEATKRIGREVDEKLTVASRIPDWAIKKKPPQGLFWSRVSAELSDLPKRFSLGDGLSET
jgi:hypothetical protein